MNLRNLLPIGRTVDPSGERSGRFRPAAPGLLPVFSREAPTESAPMGTPSGTPDGSSAAAGDALSDANPFAVGRDSAGSREVRKVGMGTAADEISAQTRPKAKAEAKSTAKGNANNAKSGRRLPLWLEQWIWALMRSGNRRRGTRPVQGELFSEPVKVAKNDLVASDVEVVVRVPAKPKAMSATCRARLMGLWWAPVARRLGRLGDRSRES